ncbi:MAG: hypothetical protein JXQ73_24590 [Phycisphaerae bacterium]|nr:hypothetical protein [Phycisphaerae bacterium]
MQGLPRLDNPVAYRGLYVFDFGDSVAVGYTAAEIAVLLESEKHADGKAYKIQRAYPNGRLELKGVSSNRFRTEDGFFFYRREPAAARRDFEDLRRLGDATPPPCRCKAHLATIPGATTPSAVALIYPAEYADEMSAWLNAIDYAGGDLVEGGPSQVSDYYGAQVARLDQYQLWPAEALTSRSAEEVLATTHLAVQRRLG